MAGRVLVQRQVLVTALTEGQEQREQDRADQEPARHLDVDDDRARDGAQHEPAGDDDHVHDDDVLEPCRVGDQQDDVREGRHQEGAREQRGQREARRDERGRRRDGDPDGEPAGGDRPDALARIQAVSLSIGDVVEQVDGAGQRAEDRERRQRRPHGAREQPLREDQPREDEQIFDPLSRAHRDHDRFEHRHRG